MERFERPLRSKEVNGWDMVHYPSELGHEPKRIRGEDYWYLSPLREVRTASFKVFCKGNVWYDHGTGEGGNLMRFCMAYFKCDEDEILNRLGNGAVAPVARQDSRNREPDNPAKHIRIEAVQPIAASYLKYYLTTQKIPLPLQKNIVRKQPFPCTVKAIMPSGFRTVLGVVNYAMRSSNEAVHQRILHYSKTGQKESSYSKASSTF